MQDDGTAGNREILDLPGIGAVHASRTSAALWPRARGGYPAQVDVHHIVAAQHTLDTHTDKVG